MATHALLKMHCAFLAFLVSAAGQSVEIIEDLHLGSSSSYAVSSRIAQSFGDCQQIFLASGRSYRFALWCPKGCSYYRDNGPGECQYQTDLEDGSKFRGGEACQEEDRLQQCIGMRRVTWGWANIVLIVISVVTCLHFLMFLTWLIVSRARKGKDSQQIVNLTQA